MVSIMMPNAPSPTTHSRRQDHPLRLEPIREHPTEQREHQHRRGLSGKHVGQVGRRPGDLEYRERDTDPGEPDGERREQPVGEQEPESRMAST